jgi:hypothetical protein
MSEKSTAAESRHEIGSAFDLLGKSLEIVKKNWQAFAVVNILAILSAIGNIFGDDSKKMENGWAYQPAGDWGGFSGAQVGSLLGFGALALLLFVIVGIFLFTMATSLEVKSAAGKKPDLSELFEDGKKYFLRIIGVVLLSGLLIVGGLILFIIPGIFALGRLVMAPYHLVDKDLGVIEAMKRSNDQAKGRMILVYAAIGVMILVSILAGIIGVIPVIGPLVGAAVTIAYSVVLALRYQQLKAAA